MEECKKCKRLQKAINEAGNILHNIPKGEGEIEKEIMAAWKILSKVLGLKI